MERPLDPTTNVEALKAEWSKDKFYTSCLKLTRLDQSVVVNFNIAFRMSVGLAEAKTTFFVSPQTTVANLLADVKQHLKLPKTANQYCLMGYVSGETGACAQRDPYLLGTCARFMLTVVVLRTTSARSRARARARRAGRNATTRER